MFPRIHHIEAGRHDADGPALALGCEHASMGMPIDAARKAGQHVHPRHSKAVADGPSSFATCGGGVAGAHDRHPPTRQQA